MVTLPWPRDQDAAVQDRLRSVKRLLTDERVEIAARGNAVYGALDPADVDRVPHHLSETLRGERQAAPRPQSQFGRARQDLLLREASRGEVLEYLLHKRRAFGIRHEALPGPFRGVEISQRCRKCPASKLQRPAHAGARAFRPYIVVELCERRQ